MRKLMLVAFLGIVGFVTGCAGLEKARVEQERGFFIEAAKAQVIIEKSDLPEAEKRSWRLFWAGQDFRIKQEEEAVK